MRKKFISFLLGGNFAGNQDEISRQNRLAIRYFAIAGIPVALANAISQFIVRSLEALGTTDMLLICYFVLLFLADRFVIPKNCKRSTLLVYLLEAPVMIISILLGTVWDPTHQAVTFPMFMSIIPIFILDTPLRVMGVSLAWNALFMALVTTTKDPAFVGTDFIHAAEFYFVSVAVTCTVLRLRFEVMHNLDRATYHLEHDLITNTRNRLCLEAHADQYLNKDLILAVGNIDYLELVNDFYGTDAGDEVFGRFATICKDVFEERHVYRYESGGLLCITPGGTNKSAGMTSIDTCMRRMSDAQFHHVHIATTCSFGYVTGSPENPDQLAAMIQLATIYMRQAKRQGKGTIVGSAFSKEALHDGKVLSNTGMHARSYEVNQLTGLPTLPFFVARSEEMLHTVVDHSRPIMIGAFKIAEFRSFNDAHGYEEGDCLIRQLGQLLQEAFPNRQVCYVTGSRFVVMCYRDQIDQAMESIQEGLNAFLPRETPQVRAGFAEYRDGDSIIVLVDKARVARQHIKGQNGAAYRIYDRQLDEQLRLDKYLVNHLDQAIAEGWLQVYYQSIIRSSDGRLCNLEALSRWIDPTYGMLPPGRFISVLEREHLVYKLSLHVIRQVLADIKRMHQMGLPEISVSVNLSRTDFSACNMPNEINSLVSTSGLQPNVLNIEITESAFAESEEQLRSEVNQLHELGFAVWMDDFGSEYSTLNLLEDLHFDLVKLDMRFMRNFVSNGRNAVIVSSIINMCQELGMDTLAEGVEEEIQAELLREMGSGRLQGFLYSRPLPLDEVLDLARTNDWI